MTDERRPDLSVCRLWQKSTSLGDARIGIIPAWNAVTLLNPSAAGIWDLLIETGDAIAAARAYTDLVPARAATATADVMACIEAWARQGLFDPPPAPPEQSALDRLEAHPVSRPGQPVFRRAFAISRTTVRLEIVDPTLAAVIEDLLVDFPETDVPPAHHLEAIGPAEGWYLLRDGAPVRFARSLVEARGQIVAELVRLAGGDAGWLATAHGAALVGSPGAVFLAGRSGAGKSTLSAGLVARGWAILAEDIAAFDADCAVSPMPFALSIKDGAVPALADAFPGLSRARVHTLGPRRVRYQDVPAPGRARRPERPGLILDVRYTPELGDGPARLRGLAPIETLGLFLNEESYVDFEHPDAARFLAFVEATPAFEIRYGRIAEAERAMCDRLDRHRERAE